MNGPHVERQIEEALKRGEFDNLPGAGEPLDLSDADDPNWWVKRFMERERLSLAEAMPPMLALRKQAEGFPQALAGLRDEAAVRQVLEAYNDAVRREIARPVTAATPPVLAHPVDVDAMVARWQAECRPPAAEPEQEQESAEQRPFAAAEPAAPQTHLPHPRTPATDPNASEAERPSWWRRILLGE